MAASELWVGSAQSRATGWSWHIAAPACCTAKGPVRLDAEVAKALGSHINQRIAWRPSTPALRRAVSSTLQRHIVFGSQRVRAFDVLARTALDEIGVGGDQRLGRIGNVA